MDVMGQDERREVNAAKAPCMNDLPSPDQGLGQTRLVR